MIALDNGDARLISLADGMPGDHASSGSAPLVVAGPTLMPGIRVEENTPVGLGAHSERSKEVGTSPSAAAARFDPPQLRHVLYVAFEPDGA